MPTKKSASPDSTIEIQKTKLNPETSSSPKSKCCTGSTNCGTPVEELVHQHSIPISGTPIKNEAKKGPKTRIVVRYNVGFNNFLSIRGKGPGLSWDKGVHLKNVKHDEWLWETETPFNTCEFKVLINDSHYEIGENHPISCGASVQYTPQF